MLESPRKWYLNHQNNIHCVYLKVRDMFVGWELLLSRSITTMATSTSDYFYLLLSSLVNYNIVTSVIRKQSIVWTLKIEFSTVLSLSSNNEPFRSCCEDAPIVDQILMSIGPSWESNAKDRVQGFTKEPITLGRSECLCRQSFGLALNLNKENLETE